MRRTAAVVVAVCAAVGPVVAGCGGAGDGGDGAERLTVYAAASLRGPFTELGRRFEADHPGLTVDLVFAGSADLVAQLTEGAVADVLATADTATMDRAGAAGLLETEPVDFATNVPTVVTAPGNPRGVGSFADLARPDLQVVVCAPQVPCGVATARLEELAGVRLRPVSEESSVTDVLNKVTTGQADAGVVYATDARAAGDRVTAVPVPQAAQVPVDYPIAVLTRAVHLDAAHAFVDLVTGPTGRRVLSAAGFGAPQ